MRWTILVAALARLYPWPVEVSEELRDALAVLSWELSPEQVVRGGYGAGMLVAVAGLVAVPATGIRWPVVTLAVCALALWSVHVVHTLPTLAATARRTSALGAAPDLVARAVLSMRLSPTPERAAAFAARTGDGPLADSLAQHVRQTQHSARSGLSTFGDAWADLFPSLRRSCTLLSVAGRTGDGDRQRLLDRALTVVLDGTGEQMQSFAASIRGPATALYAFGVLLPTALVALLPAASAAGVAVSPPVVVALYNVCLPAVLIGASAWLLARRPVAFPPPTVSSDHADVPDRRLLALLAGIGAGTGGWLAAARLLPEWGPPVAALGFGCGTALVVVTRPVVAVYDRIRAVEDGLADALELVGRRVANGRAVETAIAQVATDLDGPMGDVLAAGARQQRQLQVSVHEAFLGRHGALDEIPSPRVQGSVALLALAADEGRPAGSALLALAGHVEDLQAIEREARHSLANVCRTLRTTALCFGPLVAGSTVALADGISGEGALPGGEQSLGWLGAPVGGYVLVLAVLLTTLSVGLTRGFDRSLVGYRVGQALVCATGCYLGAYLVVGTVI